MFGVNWKLFRISNRCSKRFGIYDLVVVFGTIQRVSKLVDTQPHAKVAKGALRSTRSRTRFPIKGETMRSDTLIPEREREKEKKFIYLPPSLRD